MLVSIFIFCADAQRTGVSVVTGPPPHVHLGDSLPLRAVSTAALASPGTTPAALRKCSAVLSFQAAELADYTARIATLEDAKKRKEEDAILWQNRVSMNPCHCL